MRPGLAGGTFAREVLAAGLVVAPPLVLLWATGNMGELAKWAAGQRDAQNALARAIRRMRAGEGGELVALLGLAFACGVFHAARPGHGKVLIGGYGVARRVPLGPQMALALVSSLAQATVAVVLVYAGIAIFDWTRERLVGAAEEVMLPVSHAAVALIGLWLASRGLRGLMRRGGWPAPRPPSPRRHLHPPSRPDRRSGRRPHHPAPGAGAGGRDRHPALHRGAVPSGADLADGHRRGGDRGGLCDGPGTVAITVAVAGRAVRAREGMLSVLSANWVARALPVIELAAGLAIAAVSGLMLFAAL